MRFLLKVSIPVEAGNKAAREGRLGETIEAILAEPGWKWSEHVKPIAKTQSCQAPHTQYHVSGRLRVKMNDGTESEFGPGDVSHLPPGHDAWVVGNETVVVIDITGMTHFAEQTKK